MKLFFGCAVLAATLTVKAQTSEALLNYSPNGGGYANGTAGWTFQPLTDISVTALGCLNYSLTNSGAQPIEVGLWAANGTLLASNTITTGSLSLDISHYEFITPVMLASNQLYYLGAFATSGAMDITAYDPQSRIVLGSATMSPEIQLGAGAHSSWWRQIVAENKSPKASSLARCQIVDSCRLRRLPPSSDSGATRATAVKCLTRISRINAN